MKKTDDIDALLDERTAHVLETLRKLQNVRVQLKEASMKGVEKADEMLLLPLKKMKEATTEREKNAWLFIVSVATYAYEVAVSFHGAMLGSNDFSRSIGLKNAVHKMYEFDEMFAREYVGKIKGIAADFEVEIRIEDIQSIRKIFSKSLKILKKYRHVRNVAGGHFDADMLKYIDAVQSLDYFEVKSANMVLQDFCFKTVELVFVILRQAKRTGAPEFSGRQGL
ncbi:hypothetical protein ACTJKQ_12680 [Acidovorax sp. 22279]|uniref:hypothetical protein n=1 Tax=Acidovorax sp. 22279 TaxID=3453900 RepID=UPI003F85CE08